MSQHGIAHCQTMQLSHTYAVVDILHSRTLNLASILVLRPTEQLNILN